MRRGGGERVAGIGRAVLREKPTLIPQEGKERRGKSSWIEQRERRCSHQEKKGKRELGGGKKLLKTMLRPRQKKGILTGKKKRKKKYVKKSTPRPPLIHGEKKSCSFQEMVNGAGPGEKEEKGRKDYLIIGGEKALSITLQSWREPR